jgi:hypothetical protein
MLRVECLEVLAQCRTGMQGYVADIDAVPWCATAVASCVAAAAAAAAGLSRRLFILHNFCLYSCLLDVLY